MDHFTYRGGVLMAEDAPLPEIAAAVGTPFYCYSTATLTRHYRLMEEALGGFDALVAFAVKACPNVGVVSTLARLGAGADVVSEGELRRAMAAGVPAEKIVFAGVGKTRDELAFALHVGVGQINVESAEEMAMLADVAESLSMQAPVALRVNPNVDARTHAKITTGRSEDKFGAPIDRAPELLRAAHASPHLAVVGVGAHIGSQLTELEPFRAAFAKLRGLVDALRSEGIPVARVDLGGGLGIPYVRSNQAPPLPFDYGAVVRETMAGVDATLVIEPGRLIAGNAGVLVSRVVRRKEGAGRVFLVVDAAMNDLLRPAMYDAHHDIEAVTAPGEATVLEAVDVVGPICESSDVFGRARMLPRMDEGDLVAFRSAGAYGASMSSEYNSRLLVPEVLVNGSAFEIVRRRPTYVEMLARESAPSWLEET